MTYVYHAVSAQGKDVVRAVKGCTFVDLLAEIEAQKLALVTASTFRAGVYSVRLIGDRLKGTISDHELDNYLLTAEAKRWVCEGLVRTKKLRFKTCLDTNSVMEAIYYVRLGHRCPA
jgi:hypothetical protein